MKNVVKTDQAPGAIGPYSQGIQVGGYVFFLRTNSSSTKYR